MPADEDVDADAILAELEAEDELSNSTYRQQRAQELAEDSRTLNRGVGTASTSTRQDVYTTLNSDDDTLQFTTEHERAVVHFFHPDFARCNIMDEHLSRIADRHGIYGGSESGGEDIALGKVNVNNAPFVVEKLGIRVLPCVIGFSKGIVKGKVIGFNGVCFDGKEKDFRVSVALEDAFVSWGVLKHRLLKDEDVDSEESEGERTKNLANTRRGITGRKQLVTDEDDDWD